MPDGGWVATHEDITEKIEAENEIKRQEEQLNAALDNISQGVCMFDASQRLIICNKQYADIYGLTEEQTKPGTPIQAILEHRIASGNAPEDHRGLYQGPAATRSRSERPIRPSIGCATAVTSRSSISP